MGLDYDFVKVLDFGLVRFSDRGRSSSQLAPDQLTTGTPAFMAPEIIMGASDIDPRADVYSLGCLAYWMLTGHFVFEENSSLKMMRAHVDRSPLPPSARSELPVPHKLDSLVLACLEKDPARRPQSAWELWQMSLAWSSRNTWSQPAAKGWWEAHLPQLTHPLVLAIPAVTPASEFPPITRL